MSLKSSKQILLQLSKLRKIPLFPAAVKGMHKLKGSASPLSCAVLQLVSTMLCAAHQAAQSTAQGPGGRPRQKRAFPRVGADISSSLS